MSLAWMEKFCSPGCGGIIDKPLQYVFNGRQYAVAANGYAIIALRGLHGLPVAPKEYHAALQRYFITPLDPYEIELDGLRNWCFAPDISNDNESEASGQPTITVCRTCYGTGYIETECPHCGGLYEVNCPDCLDGYISRNGTDPLEQEVRPGSVRRVLFDRARVALALRYLPGYRAKLAVVMCEHSFMLKCWTDDWLFGLMNLQRIYEDANCPKLEDFVELHDQYNILQLKEDRKCDFD